MLYRYRPLKKDHTYLRFLDLRVAKSPVDPLRCRIDHAYLGSVTYNALSYTWGEPVFEKSLIVEDSDNGTESELLITSNLDLALRRMRLDYATKRYLWVDAVCINQMDSVERTQQIQLMGVIYSSAERVLVWTGLDNEKRDGERCLAFLARLLDKRIEVAQDFPYRNENEYLDKNGSTKKNESDENEGVRYLEFLAQFADEKARTAQDFPFVEQDAFVTQKNAYEQKDPGELGKQPYHQIEAEMADRFDYITLSSFFQRPYFSRRWIIQEVSLAQKISVYVGGAVLDGEAMWKAMSTVLSSPNRQWAGIDGAIAFHAMRGGTAREEAETYTPVGFMPRFHNFQCREEKDHVFAMLGIFERRRRDDYPPLITLTAITYKQNIADLFTALASYQLAHELDTRRYSGKRFCPFAIAELLSLAGATRDIATVRSSSNTKLPSWVPDWRKRPRYGIHRFSHYQTDWPRASPWTNTASSFPSHFLPPGELKVYGLPVDTIVDCVNVDTTKTADIERFQLHLANWNFTPCYRRLYGSVLEVISDLIVAHCHMNGFGSNVSSWVQENRRKLFYALNQKHWQRPVEFSDFAKALPDILRGRSFVYTESGYIGISCEDTRRGDQVVILPYSPISFVFRRLDQPSTAPENEVPFEVIGDSYVHGLDILSFNLVVPKSLLIY